MFAGGGGEKKRIGGRLIRHRRFANDILPRPRNFILARDLLAEKPAVFAGFRMAQIGLNGHSKKKNGDDDRCVAKISQGENSFVRTPIANRNDESGLAPHAGVDFKVAAKCKVLR